MKQLSLLSLIFLFAAQGLFSQIHLLQDERHGYDFTWQYLRDCGGFPCNNLGWESRASFGYTHAGRLNVSVAWLSRNGFTGDIITPTTHLFDTEIGFALLKQGLNDMPITLTGISGIRLGNGAFGSENMLKVGLGVYKRIERSEVFSINPGASFLYFREFGGAYNGGFYDFLLSCDFLFNKFKIGPYVSPLGRRLGFNLGFVLPTFSQ